MKKAEPEELRRSRDIVSDMATGEVRYTYPAYDIYGRPWSVDTGFVRPEMHVFREPTGRAFMRIERVEEGVLYEIPDLSKFRCKYCKPGEGGGVQCESCRGTGVRQWEDGDVIDERSNGEQPAATEETGRRDRTEGSEGAAADNADGSQEAE